MSIASQIRQFFKDLRGSTVEDELRLSLERERDGVLQLRQDFERRLEEKEQFLVDYRAQLQEARNKIQQYELVLIPLSSSAGKQWLNQQQPNTKPTFDLLDSGPSSWEKQQEEWYKQQEIEAQAEKNASSTEVIT